MNENDNFESLRRLFALKRHEVPPPGYFDRFSGQVISRIRAGETGAAAPWYLRLMQMFEAKPAFASSFASALCLLLLFGIVYAEQSDQTPQPLLPTAQLSPQLFAANAAAVAMPQPSTEQNIFAEGVSNSSPSSLQPMFGNGGNAFAQPASFSFSGQ